MRMKKCPKCGKPSFRFSEFYQCMACLNIDCQYRLHNWF